MANFCGNCGAAVESGTKFCGKCGAQIEISEQSIPKQNNTIEQTRQVEEPRQVVQPTNQAGVPMQQAVEKKGNGGKIALFAVLGIVIIGAALILGGLGSADDPEGDGPAVVADNDTKPIEEKKVAAPVTESEIYGTYTAVVDVTFNEYMERIDIPEEDLIALDQAAAGRLTLSQSDAKFEYINVETAEFDIAAGFSDFSFNNGKIAGREVVSDFVDIELDGTFSRDEYQGEEKLWLHATAKLIFKLEDGNKAVMTYTFDCLKD